MALLVDIETVPAVDDPDALAVAVASAAKRARRYGDDEDEAVARANDEFSFSPWTARVAVVAMYDTDRAEGCCFVDGDVEGFTLPRGFYPIANTCEAQLVRDAWRSIGARPQIVTWNGFGFDVPFLVGRAVALGVQFPMSLLDAKPWDRAHLDLCAFFAGGERRNRAGLDLVCAALGLPSPKGDLTGADVAAAWRDGRRADVARYCCLDVLALLGVYRALCVSTGWPVPPLPPEPAVSLDDAFADATQQHTAEDDPP